MWTWEGQKVKNEYCAEKWEIKNRDQDVFWDYEAIFIICGSKIKFNIQDFCMLMSVLKASRNGSNDRNDYSKYMKWDIK